MSRADRPVRKRKVPARLADYDLSGWRSETSEVHSRCSAGSVSQTGQLERQQHRLIKSLKRQMDKSANLIANNGSESVLNMTVDRLNSTFTELEGVTRGLAANVDDDFYAEAEEWLGDTQERVENHTDEVVKYLEEREVVKVETKPGLSGLSELAFVNPSVAVSDSEQLLVGSSTQPNFVDQVVTDGKDGDDNTMVEDLKLAIASGGGVGLFGPEVTTDDDGNGDYLKLATASGGDARLVGQEVTTDGDYLKLSTASGGGVRLVGQAVTNGENVDDKTMVDLKLAKPKPSFEVKSSNLPLSEFEDVSKARSDTLRLRYDTTGIYKKSLVGTSQHVNLKGVVKPASTVQSEMPRSAVVQHPTTRVQLMSPPRIKPVKDVVRSSHEEDVQPDWEMRSDHSSHPTVDEIQIGTEVASLKVEQEKRRYLEEKSIREAEDRLKMNRLNDAAERLNLEQRLRSQSSMKSQLSTGVSTEGPAHSVNPGTHEVRNDDVQRFFQGVAKPKLKIFCGEKDTYFQWKEEFDLFVHNTNVDTRFKMVMLKSGLSGKPLQLVKKSGYSLAHYNSAREKLEDRYGGKRRQIQRHIDALMSQPNLTERDLPGLEDFVDKLTDAVTSLKEAGSSTELHGESALYTIVMQRIPDGLVLAYQDSNPRPEGLDTLSRWLDRYVGRRLELRELKGASRDDQGEPLKERRRHHKNERGWKQQNALAGTASSSQGSKCEICQKGHTVEKCFKWRAMSVEERWQAARSSKLCFRCLTSSHLGWNCESWKKCGVGNCERKHHRDLHQTNSSGTSKPKDGEKAEQSSQPDHSTPGKDTHGVDTHHGKTVSDVIPSQVSLRLIPIELVEEGGRKVRVTALLDEGSDTSYIRQDVAKMLNLTGPAGHLNIATLNDQMQMESRRVEVTIRNMENSLQRDVKLWTIGELCGKLNVTDWHDEKHRYNHLEDIPFPRMPKDKTVDVLLGSDYPDLSICLDERMGSIDEPIARKTPLGWTCVGRISNLSTNFGTSTIELNSLKTSLVNPPCELAMIDRELRLMWDHDVLDTPKEESLTPDEMKAVDIVTNSLEKLPDRYQISIPWRDGEPKLPDNRQVAERRLRSLEAGMRKRSEVADRYREVFNGNIEKGYIRKISAEEAEVPGWYLPHFAVIREDKQTTKVRIVYDSAATHEGTSLNEKMFTGPKLQRDILDILLVFRRHEVALIGDIKEMFYQVQLNPEDRRFHRLLWRDLDSSRQIEVYESVRLVFGDRSSPFLAQFVMQNQATQQQDENPLAAEAIHNQTYMDDVITSIPSTDEAVTLRKELKTVLGEAGFEIRRWCSNVKEVLHDVPVEDCATGVNIEDADLPKVKTLGVVWDAQEDVFTFVSEEKGEANTKRMLLSKIATTFDPFQFLAPIVIRGKIALQEAWLLGLDWDAKLPTKLQEEVDQWLKQLSLVQEVLVPRCYIPVGKAVLQMTVHVFCDASKMAYGAVSYMRMEHPDNTVTVRMIAAKARVAPLRAISIPRLELMAGVLGVRLAQIIARVLKLGAEQFTYWSDSTDVIHWVKGQSRRYKPFVANRVSEIHSVTNPGQWRHVPGVLNPADDASRGLNVHQMLPTSRWFCGPDFLKEDKLYWPTEIATTLTEEAQDELPKSCITNAQMCTPKMPLIDVSRFSKWSKLVRVMATVLRFVDLVKGRKVTGIESFSAVELQDAERMVLRQVQREVFAEEIHSLKAGKVLRSSLLPLSPIVGQDELLRVGGRLQQSSLPYDARHPILLPKSHPVSELLIRHFHEKAQHVKGVNGVLAEMRQKYWVINGREAIKKIERACVTCMKLKRKPCDQVMASLPSLRTDVPIRAFAHCGVDYGGPFLVKLTRRCRAKRYLCLFTCLSSRAVHLEVAYGLDTASFLNALTRMVARRGRPIEMVSDNGTNFVGADRELRELFDEIDQMSVSDKLAAEGIKWRFNPPLGSHHGGVFESMIKAAKRALRAILGEAIVTDEELLTAVTEVEALLNSRPLLYCSSDPKDEPVLTPNHFLIGQAGGQLAPPVAEEVSFNLKNRWRYVQDLARKVWVRWQKEYLSILQSKSKWFREKTDLAVGDVVLMVEPNNLKGHWPLAVVEEVFPGPDGRVRTVEVYALGKRWRRPVVRLCLLEGVVDRSD